MAPRTPGRLIAGFVTLALAAALSGCSQTDQNTLDGAALFANQCSQCHGAQGGGGVGPRIGAGGRASLLSDEEIAAIIRSGPGVMPSFDGLTEAQVAAVIDHLRVLQGG